MTDISKLPYYFVSLVMTLKLILVSNDVWVHIIEFAFGLEGSIFVNNTWVTYQGRLKRDIMVFLGDPVCWVDQLVTCNAQHWYRNPGNEGYDGLRSLIVLCYGLNVRYFPFLDLPVFNGDVLQWQSFRDQFVAAVDSTDLSGVSKFSYLRASLEGEPKAAIKGLSLKSAHYASACRILKDRFGCTETYYFHTYSEVA